MTTLNQLFQELIKVKVEDKKARKKRVEKYNLIETPNELNVEKEIHNIFSQFNVLKNQVKEHENKQILKKEEENNLLGDLEELLFKKVEQKIEQKPEQKTENKIEEISEELPVEEVEQKTEEKSKEILIDEIKPKLEIINQYTNHITQEENKKDKNVLHERTNYDILNREIELLKKRISSLSTQLVTNSTQYLGKSYGNGGGGELNLVNPIKIYEDFNISGYGSNDVFLCFTHNNDINIYLPNSDQNYGMKVHVKKMHRDHQLYIRGYNDNQLIDEKEFITVTTVYLNYTMVCDGKDWYIVGVSGSVPYIHDQSTSAITWTINHNLDTRPVNIVVTDRNYNLILIEDVNYVSSDTIEITFPSAQDGWATVTV